MIKKLVLTLTFLALTTIAFDGTTHAAEEGGTIAVSEELFMLKGLYEEGVISEEEFSKAKSLLLNPVLDKSEKKEKINLQKLTAVERRDLKEAEQEELKALKEQQRAERKAGRERIIAEKNKIIEERQRVCSDDPQSEECKKAKSAITSLSEKLKILGQEIKDKGKKDSKKRKLTAAERKQLEDAEQFDPIGLGLIKMISQCKNKN